MRRLIQHCLPQLGDRPLNCDAREERADASHPLTRLLFCPRRGSLLLPTVTISSCFSGSPQQEAACLFWGGTKDGAGASRSWTSALPLTYSLSSQDPRQRRGQNPKWRGKATHEHFYIGLRETSAQLLTPFVGLFPASHRKPYFPSSPR